MDKWRVILRYSLNGKDPSLRNDIDSGLSEIGLTRTGTATWESAAMAPMAATAALHRLMQILMTQTASGPLKLDHLWVYIDQSSHSPDSD